MNFSKYKIHIPTEKTAGALLEPGDEKFFSQKEIYNYEAGIKILLKEKRALWLPNNLMHDSAVVDFFKRLGIVDVA